MYWMRAIIPSNVQSISAAAFMNHHSLNSIAPLPKRFETPGRQVYFEVFFRAATRYHCIVNARVLVRAVLFSFVREGLSIQQWSCSCSTNPHTDNGQQKTRFSRNCFILCEGRVVFSCCELFVNRTQPSNSVKYFFRASAVLTFNINNRVPRALDSADPTR